MNYISLLYRKVLSFINKGQKRSVLAKKNVIASFFARGVDIGVSILLVPLILSFVGQTRYGIWLTIVSVVGWLSMLDVGLGQGLRNRFAEAKSRGNDKQAKAYVSTAYAFLSVIIFSFLILFFVANIFIPWRTILNVPQNIAVDLKIFALIVFGFYSLQFLFKLITRVVVADQKPAVKDAILATGKVLILVVLYVLFLTLPGSLIHLAFVYSGLPVAVLIFATAYLFLGKYKKYAPSLKYVKFEFAEDLLGLGWKFFLIQIALVVILSTDNIIITQLFGPAHVTPYQIASKYFRLIYIAFNIIAYPLWSAASEALVKKDFKWIKSSVWKLQKIAIFFTVVSVIMLIFSKFIYNFWVGETINISYLLSFLWLSFVVVQMFNTIYWNVTNAAGKLNFPLYIYLFTMFLNIPLSICFAKWLKMGISGVILTTVICQSIHLFYLPSLYKKVVKLKQN